MVRRHRDCGGLVRALLVLAAAGLGACAGVSTLPVYQSQSPQWVSPLGGNPFVIAHGNATLRLSVIGLWRHWWWVGPLPLPLIPSVYPGQELTVVLASEPPRYAQALQAVQLIADGKDLQLLGRTQLGDDIRFRFKSPDFHPGAVTVRIEGLPDATLLVGKERCYWRGDSFPTYASCSDAAKSADPPP